MNVDESVPFSELCSDEEVENVNLNERSALQRLRKPQRRPRSRPRRHEANVLLQPEMALDLFFEPPKQPLWTESLRWNLECLFTNSDEALKALAFDYRNTLHVARKALLTNKSNLPELNLVNEKCKAMKKQTVTLVKFKEEEKRNKVVLLKKNNNHGKKPKFTLLQRPSTSSEKTVEEPALEAKPVLNYLNDNEAQELLDEYVVTQDVEKFNRALASCVKSANRMYACVLELLRNGRPLPEFKYNAFSKFASACEKHYLNIQEMTMRNSGDEVNTFLSDSSSRAGDEDWSLNFSMSFLKFLREARKAHENFIDVLETLLGGFDDELKLFRDLSGERIGLYRSKERSKPVPVESAEMFKAVRGFLYAEYLAQGFIELALNKTFKLKSTTKAACSAFNSEVFNAAASFFVKAAIVEPSKVLPFGAIKNSSNEMPYLAVNLLGLYAYIRDNANNRSISLELRNLSKLYTVFYPVFAGAYDYVFNSNYRQWTPIKTSGKQRWLVPDGVNDPLYDANSAKRLLNYLKQFAAVGLEKEFKFFILNRIDLDVFEENVIVAMGGLTVGIAADLPNLTQLVLLSRFLISVASICAANPDANVHEPQKRLRTACRLIVEYLAVLIKKLNSLLENDDTFVKCIVHGEFPTEAFVYLQPILIITYWMSRFESFFNVEVWRRRWSLDTNLLADLWPEMAALGDKLLAADGEGLFKYIDFCDETEQHGLYVPELLNSYGCSPVFDKAGPKMKTTLDNRLRPEMDEEVDVRMFLLLDTLKRLSTHGRYFTLRKGRNFIGQSDAMRVLVDEPEYIDTPSLLPVPLNEIVECVNRRKTEVPPEQARELAEVVELAKATEQDEKIGQLGVKDIVVVVKPQYIVIDTNVFIDDLDCVLEVIKDTALTVAIPTPVISELRGLRRRVASPEGDPGKARQVSDTAVRCVEVLETLKALNVKLLLCNGTLRDFDMTFFERLDETNNDRLIIDAARKLSEKVSARSHRVPCGEVWIYRNVLLVTRDRVMMLLASAHRLPSLDLTTFARWARFRK